MICDKCGATMVSRVEGSSLVAECPNCKWNVATSHVDPIYEDRNVFSLSILPNNALSKPVLSIISKMAGVNYLGAKIIAENGQENIFEGEAPAIYEKKELLDKASISYSIKPDYPY